MKSNLILFVIAVVFIVFSSSHSKKVAATSNKELNICVSMELLKKPVDSLRMDPLQIDSLALNKNCLDVYVSYGGGCGEVRFNMFYTNIVLNSFPPQTTIYLEFEDNDHCRSIVNKKLTFNMEPFLENAKNGGIWIQIANEKESRILYRSE